MAKPLEGKTLYYHEDGSILEVEVVENTSDHEWVRLKLRQKRVVDPGPYKPGPDGEEFDVSCRNDFVSLPGGWTLRTEPNGFVMAPYVGQG